MSLRVFQRRFLSRALDPAVDTAVLSVPRGNGKSWLSARILIRCLTPGDALHVPGAEYLLCAASIEQARIVYRFIRAALEPTGGYRWTDSHTRIGVTHVASNTRLRVMSSNAKTAMGIVGCPVLVADEPGSWEVVGGELMHDAIQTAAGKPGSPLKVVYIGTIAPARAGWWPQLVARGSHGSTYVQAIQGDPKRWDSWPEIRRCNPLTAVSPKFRAKLLEERDEARRDTRLKARFLSYRLNVPTADESEMLLTVDDWERMTARAVPERGAGAPVVGVDLGGGRAWSAAVAVWLDTLRVEAVAVAPGVPDIADQERRDLVPRGTYRELVDIGALRVAEGYRMQPARELVHAIADEWGGALAILCDRFRLAELEDEGGAAWPIVPRVQRWSEASEDIRGLRRLARDRGMAVARGARALLAHSLSMAVVKSDSSGNQRMAQRGAANNTGRTDVAAALILAAGAVSRELERAPAPIAYHGAV